MSKCKVVYILGNAMLRGGVEAFIMNYYRHIDPNKIQIDFIYQGYDDGVYDKELLDNGSVIYHVPYKAQHPIRFSKEVKRILKEGNYHIIHSQMDAMGCWPLAIAKNAGMSIRFCINRIGNHLSNYSSVKVIVNRNFLSCKYA